MDDLLNLGEEEDPLDLGDQGGLVDESDESDPLDWLAVRRSIRRVDLPKKKAKTMPVR